MIIKSGGDVGTGSTLFVNKNKSWESNKTIDLSAASREKISR